MSDEVEPKVATVELSAADFPWEGVPPVSNVYGFCAAAGHIKILMGFAMYPNGKVLVYALESLGGAQPTTWRRVWSDVTSAADVAEDICADVEEYLEGANLRRPAENLDMDDFLECIHLYTTGRLH